LPRICVSIPLLLHILGSAKMLTELFRDWNHLRRQPNIPVEGKAGISPLLPIEHHCIGLPEPGL
jgi:hypothetical protein